ncbi:glycosyltransferase [Bdellovibrio bacteriovorus]|uniref:glycosyltransferase n=1 Tax=Bdellovibrio bacteriovorus TaxID=959 RepID=UPI0035A5DB87
MRQTKVIVAQRNTNVAEKAIPSRSVYARLLEPFEYLAMNNKISLNVIDENFLDLNAIDFDVLVFSKHTSNISLKLSEQAIGMGKKVIYDIDDFLPAFPSYSGGTQISQRISSIRKHTQIASIVTTATRFLKTQIDNYFDISTELAPNGINVERHNKHLKSKPDNLRIIFTNADLIKVHSFKNDFFKLMNSFLDQNPSIDFDIISDPNDELEGFSRFNDLGNVSWFEHKKILAENGYSVAVTPLGGVEDSDSLLFNSCKSPIKYLEYGALKIAGIYSRTPIYEEVISDKETGILVKNDLESWQNALVEISKDKKLRERITKNAFDDIRANHHVKQSSEAWLSIIQN